MKNYSWMLRMILTRQYPTKGYKNTKHNTLKEENPISWNYHWKHIQYTSFNTRKSKGVLIQSTIRALLKWRFEECSHCWWFLRVELKGLLLKRFTNMWFLNITNMSFWTIWTLLSNVYVQLSDTNSTRYLVLNCLSPKLTLELYKNVMIFFLYYII